MTLHDLLQTGADEAIAIAAPGRAPLDYRALRALVAATTASLNAGGIGRNDRVAIVLPNGPEMADVLPGLRQRGGERAAEPGLPRRRVRVLSRRPAGQGADRRARQRLAGGGGGAQARRAGDRAGGGRRRAGRPVQPRGTARGAVRSRRCRRRPPTWRWCCTPRAPRRGPRSCRCRRATWRVGRPHRGDAAVHGARCRPEHHAAVPHPRPDRRPAGAAVGGIAGVLHAGLQRAAVLRLDGRGQADLVHGGADDAPGDRQPRQAQRRGDEAPSAALPALVVVVDAAAGDRRARGGVQGAADRVLRHDRGGAPDGLATRCRRRRASPARSGARPAPRSRSWTRTARCSAPARSARSSSAARTSPRATRTTRRPTPRPSSTAGSAPATRA